MKLLPAGGRWGSDKSLHAGSTILSPLPLMRLGFKQRGWRLMTGPRDEGCRQVLKLSLIGGIRLNGSVGTVLR